MYIRERILAYGPPGSGKSHQHLKTAKWLEDSGVNFWIIDTDSAIERMLSTEFSDLSNVNVEEANTWDDYAVALDWVMKNARPRDLKEEMRMKEKGEMRDWVVVDMIDWGWEEVQRYYTNEVFGEDKGDYFLRVRKEMKSSKKNLPAYDGWKDWQVIKSLYQDWTNKLIKRSRAHLYATAKPKSLMSQDDAWAKDMFGPHGVKPGGESTLSHLFHSVLLLAKTGPNWHMSTTKDRGRPILERQKITSFPHQYLMKVAGWKRG